MISEINGVRNYSVSRNAMKTLYSIVGGYVVIWAILTVSNAVFGGTFSLPATVIVVLVTALIAGAAIPKYFRNGHLSMSEEDIVCVKGMVTDRKIFLSMDAVKSVTMVLTPFGRSTGLNFIVFNAMGSRLIVWFLDLDDCIEIYGYVNERIMKRSEKAEDTKSES